MNHDEPSAGAPGEPRLTVVLIAVQGYEIIQRTVAHLRRQTIADGIELLVMASNPEQAAIPDDVCEYFCDVRIVDIDGQRHMGSLRAEGIRQARAPYVAMAEDHCFANAVWAESLTAEHDDGADVVGPRMDNANPRTATSWAAQLIGYGRWLAGDEPCAINMLPGHNSSYRQTTMLQFGPELDALMSSEVIAHWLLQQRGSRLVYQPRARCRHVNVTRPRVLAATMFHHAHMFGAARRRNLSARPGVVCTSSRRRCFRR